MDNIFDDIETAFSTFGWESAVEVGVITLAVFWLLGLIRGTTAMTVVRGVGMVAVAVVVLSRALDSVVLNWMVNNTLAVLVLFVLIVFQPEFRRAFERVGRAGGLRSVFSAGRETYDATIHVVVETAEHLSERRTGALLVLERETGLQEVVDTGVPIDALPSADLLEGIFARNTPLHDGAVVIRPGRVVAAACILPSTENPQPHQQHMGHQHLGHQHIGTRHRAALGISERTDAVTVVVSEETGAISLAYAGRLVQRLDARRLESLLGTLLNGSGRASEPDSPAAIGA